MHFLRWLLTARISILIYPTPPFVTMTFNDAGKVIAIILMLEMALLIYLITGMT